MSGMDSVSTFAFYPPAVNAKVIELRKVADLAPLGLDLARATPSAPDPERAPSVK